jgi:hypothetical protein
MAVATHGRHACAGLVGREWLEWLAANDPAGFDWRTAGTPLLALPYAPPGTAGDREALGRLIDAAMPWARHRPRRPSWWPWQRALEPGRG